MLAFSQAAENNKEPILEILRTVFVPADAPMTVLEIGSGSGQHAVYFAQNLPHVIWQTSDLAENHLNMLARLAAANVENARPPLELDVAADPWPIERVDGVFSANALHIMSQTHVAHFFRGAGQVVASGGYLCVYGPFKYDGEFTTESNAGFDQWLKHQDPVSGIRDFEACDEMARAVGFKFLADHAMPANNQFLIWRKSAE